MNVICGNADVINKFLAKLGVPEQWQVTDVYGLDEDMLSIVPRPVLSLILLFPTSKKYDEHCVKENADIEGKSKQLSSKLYFVKQHLNNACGTVAIIHSIANNLDKIHLKDGCLKQFFNKCSGSDLSPEQKGELILKDEGIIEAQKSIADEVQTNPPSSDEQVDYHFIVFVCINGKLYELDGNRPFPIAHGPSCDETMLNDAAKVVKKIMELDPENIRFALLALTQAIDYIS